MDHHQRPPLDLQPPPVPAGSVPVRWPTEPPRLRRATDRLVAKIAKGRDVADLVHEWPGQLIALVEIAEASIRTSPKGADPTTLARCIVVAMADVLGGGRIHFPTAERVRRLLRDACVWREFDGRNVAALAVKYKLDEWSVYRIIKRQRDLRRKSRARRTA